jgi:hypothetical protein
MSPMIALSVISRISRRAGRLVSARIPEMSATMVASVNWCGERTLGAEPRATPLDALTARLAEDPPADAAHQAHLLCR